MSPGQRSFQEGAGRPAPGGEVLPPASAPTPCAPGRAPAAPRARWGRLRGPPRGPPGLGAVESKGPGSTGRGRRRCPARPGERERGPAARSPGPRLQPGGLPARGLEPAPEGAAGGAGSGGERGGGGGGGRSSARRLGVAAPVRPGAWLRGRRQRVGAAGARGLGAGSPRVPVGTRRGRGGRTRGGVGGPGLQRPGFAAGMGCAAAQVAGGLAACAGRVSSVGPL